MLTKKEAVLLELLVLRCQRGDEGAFAELIQAWERRLFFYVRRLVATEEDAWDVLQQTWVQAHQGIRRLRSATALPAWLYRIARCTAMSNWRVHYREQAHVEELAQQTEEASYDEPHAFEDAEQVAAALGRLSLEHREALTLFFLDDLSLSEMADVLGIPLGTVKSRLSYAKRALRAVLECEER